MHEWRTKWRKNLELKERAYLEQLGGFFENQNILGLKHFRFC